VELNHNFSHNLADMSRELKKSAMFDAEIQCREIAKGRDDNRSRNKKKRDFIY